MGQGWEGALWTERTAENQTIRHVMDAETLKNDGRKGGESTLNQVFCTAWICSSNTSLS